MQFIRTLSFGYRGLTSFTKDAYERKEKKRKKIEMEGVKSKSNGSGEVTLITGATGGIGYELAEKCLERKMKVHCICKSKEKGDNAMQRLREETTNGETFASLHVVDLSSLC